MLSINRYGSDAGTIVNGGDSDSSFAMTEIRGGSSGGYGDGGSEYSSGNVIVVGDGGSSYQGSETSIKLLGSNQRSRIGGQSRGAGSRMNPSNIIIDDYQS